MLKVTLPRNTRSKKGKILLRQKGTADIQLSEAVITDGQAHLHS